MPKQTSNVHSLRKHNQVRHYETCTLGARLKALLNDVKWSTTLRVKAHISHALLQHTIQSALQSA